MSINNVEIQDSVGNVYYPHTDADVVKYGNTTVGASLSEMENNKADKIAPAKITPTPINGFSIVGASASYYCKTQENIVIVNAYLELATARNTDAVTLFGLPTGYRPSETVRVPCVIDAKYIGTVWISSNGEVILYNINPSVTSYLSIYINASFIAI